LIGGELILPAIFFGVFFGLAFINIRFSLNDLQFPSFFSGGSFVFLNVVDICHFHGMALDSEDAFSSCTLGVEEKQSSVLNEKKKTRRCEILSHAPLALISNWFSVVFSITRMRSLKLQAHSSQKASKYLSNCIMQEGSFL